MVSPNKFPSQFARVPPVHTHLALTVRALLQFDIIDSNYAAPAKSRRFSPFNRDGALVNQMLICRVRNGRREAGGHCGEASLSASAL